MVYKPEYAYLDNTLLRNTTPELVKEVEEVLSLFINYRAKVSPNLNRNSYKKIRVLELEELFDNTIMLAGGRESNFVCRHYKTILVQLAFQLGFLIRRLLPESTHADYARTKISWLSTMDVEPETKLLQPFFDKYAVVLNDAPPVTDTMIHSEVLFWDIDEIRYVLDNLTGLGHDFKRYIDKQTTKNQKFK